MNVTVLNEGIEAKQYKTYKHEEISLNIQHSYKLKRACTSVIVVASKVGHQTLKDTDQIPLVLLVQLHPGERLT